VRFLFAFALFWVLPAGAHPLDPALLDVRESSGGVVDVRWRTPRRDLDMRPVLPAGCAPRAVAGDDAWTLACPRGLAGARFGVAGLDRAHTDALLRVRLADGTTHQAVLRAGADTFVVPERPGVAAVAADYGALGFRHILGGPDHLLFVLGLVLLVDGRRRLLATVTAFTAGHSVTLSLAMLGVVHVPPAPVEALIAASIFVVAVELTRDGGFGRRRPWVMAAAFGLLHGLGFAGALAEVGLPDGDIPLALASFNVGIELGQLLFVAAVLVARALLPVRGRLRLASAYGIGTLAAFWVFERVAVLV
jgi:hypothetical protein